LLTLNTVLCFKFLVPVFILHLKYYILCVDRETDRERERLLSISTFSDALDAHKMQHFRVW